ncbi:hypothetical protein HYT05_03835 [Candidatus Kaiserbacteria bacterium]|nr:hypothetical protein [Candidatus Kaiserbacteria bacterium]
MTTTASVYTIAAVFAAAEKAFLGPNRKWKPINEMQKRFVSEVLEPTRSELVRIPEITSIAALSEIPINEFLKEEGFDIQLDPFPVVIPPERAWGAASVLDVLMKWRVPGKVTTITTSAQTRFPAAKLSDETVRIRRVGNTDVAMIETETADVAYMAMWEKPLEHFELLAAVEDLTPEKGSYTPYEGLVFPMVDLDHQVDISWLKGLNTIDDENFFNKITQALQQTKLKMNHVGARIKDAVAIGGMRCTSMPNPPLVIDQPFLFWVMRPGLSRPLFAAHITQEHWKDPGSLDDM